MADAEQKIDCKPIVNGICRSFGQVRECIIPKVYELIQFLQYWALIATNGSRACHLAYPLYGRWPARQIQAGAVQTHAREIEDTCLHLFRTKYDER